MAGEREDTATEPLRITHLTTEYNENPLGLEEPLPRLGWVPESAENGQTETAFQVLAATHPDLLKEGTADLWDSGKVARDWSAHADGVAYEGRPLGSRERAFWRVRAWNGEDAPSDWSGAAWWEMGLAPEERRAQWIAGPADEGETPRPAPMLRTEFTLEKPVARARAYVCGLGYYEMALNGRRVGDHVLDPDYTQYDKRIAYVVHDVTGLLREGRNAVGVTLGRGWYAVPNPSVWNFQEAVWRGTPRLWMQIMVDHPDGTTTTIVSDGYWRTHDSPTVFDSIQVGEAYDARLEILGWDSPGFDDSGWEPARVLEPLPVTMGAQVHEPIRVIRTWRPRSVASPRPGTYVFDLGVNIAGWARLHVSGPAGTEVTLRYGEKLRDDGTVDNSNDLIPVEAQIDRYILKGEGRETWEPRFSYKGFQFVQVDGTPGAPALDDIEGCEVHSDVADTGSFACSDETLNHIHAMSRRAMLNNLYGIPTDTPVYEKNGWTGDAHLTAAMALRHFGVGNIYARWLDDVAAAQTGEGLVPLIVPCPGWGKDHSPEWGIAYLVVALEIYRHTGDARILEKHLPGMRRIVDYMLAQAEDCVSPSVLSDWLCPCPDPAKPQAPEGPAITATAHVAMAANLLWAIAKALGGFPGDDRYRAAAEDLHASINGKFLDWERCVYRTGIEAGYRQTSNVLPLAFRFVPEDVRGQVVENLVADIHARGDHLDTGILGTKYLLRVLTFYGQAELAFRVATQRTYPSWGFWAEQGATALWEAWDSHSRSRGHHMFGSIDDWLIEDIVGIRPASPGYRAITFSPHLPEGLTHARAALVTPNGLVTSSWTRKDGGFTLEAVVPVRALGTIHVPVESPEGVTVEGEGATCQRAENGRAVYALGSGAFRFDVRR